MLSIKQDSVESLAREIKQVCRWQLERKSSLLFCHLVACWGNLVNRNVRKSLLILCYLQCTQHWNQLFYRLASNAAYVIGSLAETELGAERVLSITKRKRSSSIIQVRYICITVWYDAGASIVFLHCINISVSFQAIFVSESTICWITGK